MDIPATLAKADALRGELAAWRRHLHAHPEPSWQERETTRFIIARLREWGYENIQSDIGEPGLGALADLNPGQTPCVALRADIDALPVSEESGEPFASVNPGAMHACGHDGHIACLLGAAKILAERRAELPGSVRFIFQPAEEDLIRGGAGAVIKAGGLEGVKAVAGLHLISHLPAGTVGLREGPFMAAGRIWRAVFTGCGGHGGMPHKAVDPTIPAAQFILSVQAMISRELSPQTPNIVSVGSLEAAGAPNVIPERVALRGTMRTFSREMLRHIPARLAALAKDTAAVWRCKAEFGLEPGGTAVVNNEPELCGMVRECVREILGERALTEPEFQTISEDFSLYQEKVPGVFFFLGMGDETLGTHYPHHSPKFRIDERQLVPGVKLLAAMAAKMLGMAFAAR